MILSNQYFDIDLSKIHFYPTTKENNEKRRYIFITYGQIIKYKSCLLSKITDIIIRYKFSEILNKYIDIKYEFTKEEVLKIKGHIDEYDNKYIGIFIECPWWLEDKERIKKEQEYIKNHPEEYGDIKK